MQIPVFPKNVPLPPSTPWKPQAIGSIARTSGEQRNIAGQRDNRFELLLGQVERRMEQTFSRTPRQDTGPETIKLMTYRFIP
ncbi:MAG: hypothetical protein HQL76_13585 [Magnetococcales bacterium]|nr:hypothetical protein [Magnetococcales bacterium]